MHWDIYGESLREGYCEVHPHVQEEYPCSLCYAEDRQREERLERDQQLRQNREIITICAREFEALSTKARENGYRVIIKFEKL